MNKTIKAALITGLCSVVAAFIGGYHVGSNNANATATTNNHFAISLNGETAPIQPEEYQSIYEDMETTNSQLVEENTALKNENLQLKKKLENIDTPEKSLDSGDSTFLPDVAPAYESYHYKEYSQRSSKAEAFYIAGKQYYNGMVWSAWNTGYSLYSLDGKYTEITGVLGHIDGKEMDESTLQIYFDGVLQKEVALSGEMIAQAFSIDVTGANQLKLMVSHGRGSYGYADVTIH